MNLTKEEAEQALEDASVKKVMEAITANNYGAVDPKSLAMFLVRELKPKITVSELPKRK